MKVRDLLFCLSSSLLLILSFPNFSAVGARLPGGQGSALGGNLWIFAWLGFVPLFFALQNKSKSQAFLLSYLTGVIFWLGTIYWLIHVTLPGMIVLVLYLALYFGIFGLLITPYHLTLTPYSLIFIPCLWVILEYIRSYLFTGFPWALLGYSQYLNLPIIQVADITGAWGVSFLVMLVNITIKEIIGSKLQASSYKQKKAILLPLVILILTLSYGYYRLYFQPAACSLQPVKISVIQGNIPQKLKWESLARDFIMERYFTLSREVAKDKPDLIVWPEASLPVVLEAEPKFIDEVKSLAKDINTPLLLGTVTTRSNSYYNSAILVSKDGSLLNQYDKIHLVPFGEYIPLRKTFTFLETVVPIGDFAVGKEYTLFERQNNLAVLICFEDLFPELSRRFVKKGAGFLVNITNDAWFGKTSSPYQHLQASVFRAVENRVYLVRSANTGVSGFIAPSGKIISRVIDSSGTDIFIAGYKTGEVVISEGKPLSLYTRYGDIFIAACLFYIFCSIICRFKF